MAVMTEYKRQCAQDEIFHSIKDLHGDVQNLGSHIQNDLERLLADGYTTPEEINASAEGVAEMFDRCATNLSNLRTETLLLIAQYSKPPVSGG